MSYLCIFSGRRFISSICATRRMLCSMGYICLNALNSKRIMDYVYYYIVPCGWNYNVSRETLIGWCNNIAFAEGYSILHLWETLYTMQRSLAWFVHGVHTNDYALLVIPGFPRKLALIGTIVLSKQSKCLWLETPWRSFDATAVFELNATHFWSSHL